MIGFIPEQEDQLPIPILIPVIIYLKSKDQIMMMSGVLWMLTLSSRFYHRFGEHPGRMRFIY